MAQATSGRGPARVGRVAAFEVAGLPDSGVQRMNTIYRTEATYHPGVVYVDAWHLFAKNGGYSAYMRLGTSHHLTQVREGDGVHFTVVGYQLLADDVIGVMHTVLGLKF